MLPAAVAYTIGVTLANAGVTQGFATDSIDTSKFSTNAPDYFETYADAISGVDAVRFLQPGLYLARAFAMAFANTSTLTVAQVTTLRNSVLTAEADDLFGGGSEVGRTLQTDQFAQNPGTTAATRGTGGTMPIGWRATGETLFDVIDPGVAPGGGIGTVPDYVIRTDLVTNNALPATVTCGGHLWVYRLGDPIPLANVGWW